MMTNEEHAKDYLDSELESYFASAPKTDDDDGAAAAAAAPAAAEAAVAEADA